MGNIRDQVLKKISGSQSVYKSILEVNNVSDIEYVAAENQGPDFLNTILYNSDVVSSTLFSVVKDLVYNDTILNAKRDASNEAFTEGVFDITRNTLTIAENSELALLVADRTANWRYTDESLPNYMDYYTVTERADAERRLGELIARKYWCTFLIDIQSFYANWQGIAPLALGGNSEFFKVTSNMPGAAGDGTLTFNGTNTIAQAVAVLEAAKIAEFGLEFTYTIIGDSSQVLAAQNIELVGGAINNYPEKSFKVVVGPGKIKVCEEDFDTDGVYYIANTGEAGELDPIAEPADGQFYIDGITQSGYYRRDLVKAVFRDGASTDPYLAYNYGIAVGTMPAKHTMMDRELTETYGSFPLWSILYKHNSSTNITEVIRIDRIFDWVGLGSLVTYTDMHPYERADNSLAVHPYKDVLLKSSKGELNVFYGESQLTRDESLDGYTNDLAFADMTLENIPTNIDEISKSDATNFTIPFILTDIYNDYLTYTTVELNSITLAFELAYLYSGADEGVEVNAYTADKFVRETDGAFEIAVASYSSLLTGSIVINEELSLYNRRTDDDENFTAEPLGPQVNDVVVVVSGRGVGQIMTIFGISQTTGHTTIAFDAVPSTSLDNTSVIIIFKSNTEQLVGNELTPGFLALLSTNIADEYRAIYPQFTSVNPHSGRSRLPYLPSIEWDYYLEDQLKLATSENSINPEDYIMYAGEANPTALVTFPFKLSLNLNKWYFFKVCVYQHDNQSSPSYKTTIRMATASNGLANTMPLVKSGYYKNMGLYPGVDEDGNIFFQILDKIKLSDDPNSPYAWVDIESKVITTNPRFDGTFMLNDIPEIYASFAGSIRTPNGAGTASHWGPDVFTLQGGGDSTAVTITADVIGNTWNTTLFGDGIKTLTELVPAGYTITGDGSQIPALGYGFNITGGTSYTLQFADIEITADTAGAAWNKIITGDGVTDITTLVGAGYTITNGTAILYNGHTVQISGGRAAVTDIVSTTVSIVAKTSDPDLAITVTGDGVTTIERLVNPNPANEEYIIYGNKYQVPKFGETIAITGTTLNCGEIRTGTMVSAGVFLPPYWRVVAKNLDSALPIEDRTPPARALLTDIADPEYGYRKYDKTAYGTVYVDVLAGKIMFHPDDRPTDRTDLKIIFTAYNVVNGRADTDAILHLDSPETDMNIMTLRNLLAEMQSSIDINNGAQFIGYETYEVSDYLGLGEFNAKYFPELLPIEDMNYRGLLVFANGILIPQEDIAIEYDPYINAPKWRNICYSPDLQLFCAVASEGSLNEQIITSSDDGDTWIQRDCPTSTTAIQQWMSVCWSSALGLFCAVSFNGSIMISPDGITWTYAITESAVQFTDVCWNSTIGMFAAVAFNGIIMTSLNGTVWTAISMTELPAYTSITYALSLNLFVAVAYAQSANGYNAVISSDGVTWTPTQMPSLNKWTSICWSPTLSIFVAVAMDGEANTQIATSTNGTTWIEQIASPESLEWASVEWISGLGQFLAVASNNTGEEQAMLSVDGITWTAQDLPERSRWVGSASNSAGVTIVIANGGLNFAKSDDLAIWSSITATAPSIGGSYKITYVPDGIESTFTIGTRINIITGVNSTPAMLSEPFEDNFIAQAGQTEFILTYPAHNKNAIILFINGEYKNRTNFTLIGTNVLKLDAAPGAGINVDVKYYLPATGISNSHNSLLSLDEPGGHKINRPVIDSETAFRFQDAAGTTLFSVDTINKQIIDETNDSKLVNKKDAISTALIFG